MIFLACSQRALKQQYYNSTKAVVSRTHDLPQWYPFVPADTEMLARFRVSLKLDDEAAEASEEAAPAWAR